MIFIVINNNGKTQSVEIRDNIIEKMKYRGAYFDDISAEIDLKELSEKLTVSHKVNIIILDKQNKNTINNMLLKEIHKYKHKDSDYSVKLNKLLNSLTGNENKCIIYEDEI